MKQITGGDISAMTSHWLNTPLNGYLGSDYGNDIKSSLQSPLSSISADNIVSKIQADLPVLQVVNDAVSVYAVNDGVDKSDLILMVMGAEYDLKSLEGR